MARLKHRKGVYSASRVDLAALIPSGAASTHRAKHDELVVETIAKTRCGQPMVTRQSLSTPLRKLLDQAVIGEAEAEAAAMLRFDHDFSVASQTGSRFEPGVDGGGNGATAMERRIYHLGRLRGAMGFLGGELSRIAWVAIIERPLIDIAGTFRALGEDCLPGEHKPVVLGAGKALLVVTCRELAVFYGLKQQRRAFFV